MSKIAVGLSAMTCGVAVLVALAAFVLRSDYRTARFTLLLHHPGQLLSVSPVMGCVLLGALVAIAAGAVVCAWGAART